MWSRSSWLSWLVGSSASRSWGALVTLQASASRCRSPPDIDETTWSACSPGRPGASSSASPSVRSGSPLGGAAEAEVLPGGGVVQQVAGGALEHGADPGGADPGQVPLTHAGDLLLAEEDLAGARALDAAEQGQQRRLARAAGTQERDPLAGRTRGRRPAARRRRVPRTSCRDAPGPGSSRTGHRARRVFGDVLHARSLPCLLVIRLTRDSPAGCHAHPFIPSPMVGPRPSRWSGRPLGVAGG